MSEPPTRAIEGTRADAALPAGAEGLGLTCRQHSKSKFDVMTKARIEG